MYLLLLGVILLGVVGLQFFTREAYLRVWGPVGFTVQRDEWPAFYWPLMAAEVALGALLIYLFVARRM